MQMIKSSLPSPLPGRSNREELKDMEVNLRVAANSVLCMILMLSGQQQEVAAMSKYCECYHGCYTGCRQHMPPWACMVCASSTADPTSPATVTATAAAASPRAGRPAAFSPAVCPSAARQRHCPIQLMPLNVCKTAMRS